MVTKDKIGSVIKVLQSLGALVVEKMTRSCLRWFGYAHRRPVEITLIWVDLMNDSLVVRGRGRESISQTIKMDLDLNGLSLNMIII